ncbi:MAG TPA: SRPBCC domain-containing protein [bacterium]|jgi:uncharacterized protein YndB with AHSA1/START domain
MPKASKTLLGFYRDQTYRVPLKTVWEAATQAEHLNGFFTSAAKGDICPDLEPVTWRWGKLCAEIDVVSCEPHKAFEFRWTAPGQKDRTQVRMEFSRAKGRTVVKVFEAGWKETHVDGALENCGGWSEWLYGPKAYVQHGIDLRK